MTIVRVGATKKYSDGWESAFGKGKKAAAVTGAGGKKSSGKKSAAAKASTKKKSSGKKGKKK